MAARVSTMPRTTSNSVSENPKAPAARIPRIEFAFLAISNLYEQVFVYRSVRCRQFAIKFRENIRQKEFLQAFRLCLFQRIKLNAHEVDFHQAHHSS